MGSSEPGQVKAAVINASYFNIFYQATLFESLKVKS